jgi:hypothetical protein
VLQLQEVIHEEEISHFIQNVAAKDFTIHTSGVATKGISDVVSSFRDLVSVAEFEGPKGTGGEPL